MKKNRIFLFVAILGFIVSGCVYDFVAPEAPIDPNDPNAEVISFSEDIVPIFEDNCTGCHKAGGIQSTPDLTASQAYNSIISEYVNTETPEESLIYTVPNPSGGHPAKYSTNEAALVLGWITQGAENN